MNKTIKVVLITIIALLAITTIVNAATPSEELVSYIKSQGGKYITDSHIVKIERYLKDYPVSETEKNQLKEKIDAAKAIVDQSGVNNLKNLSKADKEKLKTIANEAAAIVNVNLVFKKDSVEIYKNGKLIENIYFNEKLSSTGSQISILEVSSVAIIALATVAFLVRKNANAKQ